MPFSVKTLENLSKERFALIATRTELELPDYRMSVWRYAVRVCGRTTLATHKSIPKREFKSRSPHQRWHTHKIKLRCQVCSWLSRRRRFVSMPLASINSLNSRSTSSATFASISSSVRSKLTTIVSPVAVLPGSLVASPALASRGSMCVQNSLCKTLRLTHAFSCMSRPAMPTRKICNSRVLISASIRSRVWDTRWRFPGKRWRFASSHQRGKGVPGRRPSVGVCARDGS